MDVESTKDKYITLDCQQFPPVYLIPLQPENNNK